MAGRAQRKHPLLGAAFFLVAARAADRGVDAVTVERLLERQRLHHMGVERGAGGDRADAFLEAFLVDMDDQVQFQPFRGGVAKGDHVAELPRRVDVQQRKRHPAGAERLERQMQQDARILADRIQDGRALKLRSGLTQNVDEIRLPVAPGAR